MQVSINKPAVKKQKKLLVIAICMTLFLAYAALTFLPKSSDELPEEDNGNNSEVFLASVDNLLKLPENYADIINAKPVIKEENDEVNITSVEIAKEKKSLVRITPQKKEKELNLGNSYQSPIVPQRLSYTSRKTSEEDEAYASSMGYGSSSRQKPKSYDENKLLAYNNPTANTDKLLTSLIDGQNQTDQNSQDLYLAQASERKEIYLNERIETPISPYQIMAGSIIPGAMITGINSDLPGEITAMVRENVYDTVSGHYLLIPQGSQLKGSYDSGVLYGQNRVLFTWNRLRFPNGDSIQLRGMKGVDYGGYSGLEADVDNHYMRLTGAILMSAFLSMGTEQIDNGTTAGQSISKDVNKSGQKIVDMQLNVRPTLRISSGERFNIMVSKDIILKPYRG